METTTPNKERTNMREARLAAHLSQKQVAAKMGTHYTSINNWEKAHTTPQLSQIEPLMKAIKFTGTDDELLEVFLVEKPSMITDSETVDICEQLNHPRQLSTTCQTTPNRAILESTDSIVIHIPGSAKGIREFMEFARRQFMEVVAQLGLTASFGNLSLGLVSSPSVDPEEYLSQASTSIDACWEWLSQGRFRKVEEALSKNVPVLKRLANTIFPFQRLAASLAVKAKIMQIILATRNLDLVALEIYCGEAVHFAMISGDKKLIALSREWQGNTYTTDYASFHHPQTAIRHLNDALSVEGGDIPPLIRSAIYSDLSIAYAQDKTLDNYETEAQKFAALAHMTLPEYPELDPLYPCVQMGRSELYQFEGKMYLYLAEHSPNSGYAKLARNAFEEATSKRPLIRLSSALLIRQADTARAMGDMNECVTCLEKGLDIDIKFDSQNGIIKISNVIGRMSPGWKQETSVQNLQKEISHAIVVARR